MRKTLFLLTTLVLAGCAFADNDAAVSRVPESKNVLFLGNSLTYYNNSMHNHYRALLQSAGNDDPGLVRIMTISGGHLPEHAGGLPSMLASASWDVVVMQGHSLGPISKGPDERFRAAAKSFVGQIREAGAEPVFFMTWAYTGRPEMTGQLDSAYTATGAALDAWVVPVGLAFEVVTNERPDITLRMADGRHPTLAGTYLAACMMVAGLHDLSPEGLAYTAGLDTNVAQYLQQVAWSTSQRYLGREKFSTLERH